MSLPSLSLEKLFFPRTQVIALQNPVDPDMGAPQHMTHAYILEDNVLLVNLGVSWGDESANPYAIKVDAHAAFCIDQSQLASKQLLDRITYTATRTVFSAIREHIAQTSARGPHGTVLLPVTVIHSKDIQIRVHEQLAKTLGIEESEKGPGLS